MLNSFENLQSISIDFATLNASATQTKHTVVDHDIDIFEDLTPFSLKLSTVNENGETLNLDIKATLHVIRDDWFGFLVDNIQSSNIEAHKFTLLFKQRLQGLLYLNHDLLDRLA